MGFFIFAIILVVAGLITLAVGLTRSENKTFPVVGGVILLLLSGVLFLGSSFFQLNRGEAAVIKSASGVIQKDPVTTPGIHTKAPWDSTIKFDTLNQTAEYINSANGSDNDNNGGTRTGPYITAQDNNGVSFNISLTVRYSIDSSAVTTIYSKFKDEDSFKSQFVTQDVRSVVRKVPNNFSTIHMLNQQGKLETAIEKRLAQTWKGTGVSVDSVALQEVQAPASVTESYAKVAQAQNALQAAKIKAQQTVNAATAQAQANKILNSEPLSDKSLNQKYIDALGQGTVYVVPQGSTPLISTGK